MQDERPQVLDFPIGVISFGHQARKLDYDVRQCCERFDIAAPGVELSLPDSRLTTMIENE